MLRDTSCCVGICMAKACFCMCCSRSCEPRWFGSRMRSSVPACGHVTGARGCRRKGHGWDSARRGDRNCASAVERPRRGGAARVGAVRHAGAPPPLRSPPRPESQGSRASRPTLGRHVGEGVAISIDGRSGGWEQVPEVWSNPVVRLAEQMPQRHMTWAARPRGSRLRGRPGLHCL